MSTKKALLSLSLPDYLPNDCAVRGPRTDSAALRSATNHMLPFRLCFVPSHSLGGVQPTGDICHGEEIIV